MRISLPAPWRAVGGTALSLSLLVSPTSPAMADGVAGCLGDLDCDGVVGGSDLAIFCASWGPCGPGVPCTADLNGDGLVNGQDLTILLSNWGECPPATVTVELSCGSDSVIFASGDRTTLPCTALAVGLPCGTLALSVEQSSVPPGLELSNDVPATGLVATPKGALVFNTLIASSKPGLYTIRTTVIWDGGTVEIATPVAVLPPPTLIELSALGSQPSGLNPSIETPVVFSIAVTGAATPPQQFEIRETDSKGTPLGPAIAVLRDDGKFPDLLAGDQIYAGGGVIEADEEDTRRFYRAFEVGNLLGEGLASEVYELPVVIFPVGPAPSDPKAIVETPSGGLIYSDQVLVRFVEGTSNTRIQEIANQFKGEIAGTIPAISGFQLKGIGNGTAQGVLLVISQMKTVIDIEEVEPIFPIVVTELTPNDPLYPSQVGLKRLRAPEAWVVATGTVAIAVIDTGIDPDHPDLAGRVVLLEGSDIVGGGGTVDGDSDGHGTRMAGIAAAKGNDGIGIAGVSWNSQIVPVRGLGGSDLDLAEAIVFAASRSLKVINISGGSSVDSAAVRLAVEFAQRRGSLIVAAAGSTPGEPFYPCVYDGVLCVGAVDDGDLPLADGGSGPWVDVAAPGLEVPCTEVGGGYGTSTGTSPATALVSGAVAVILSTDPSLTVSAVRERLLEGAFPLSPSLALGRGRVDLFESVFNGSFELPALLTWSSDGAVSAIQSFGPISPTDRSQMAYLSTAAEQSPRLVRQFTIQPGVAEFAISFDYDFISAQWPEFAGDPLSDRMVIVLDRPDGGQTLLAIESVETSCFSTLAGVVLPGGSGSAGHTGWRTAAARVPVAPGPGTYTVRIDEPGNLSAGSVVLLDRIRLVAPENPIYCGAPFAGDCCESNGTPFCSEFCCCEAVCAVDPSCCEATWDASCAAIAAEVCDQCLFCGDAETGDCCEDNGTPYCDDAVCCTAVCAVDPTCCAVAWDADCAALAVQLCGCPPPTVASTFEGEVRGPDGAGLPDASISIGDLAMGTSGADGRYSISALVPKGPGLVVTASIEVDGTVYEGTAISGIVVPDGATPVPPITLGPKGGCAVTSLEPAAAAFDSAGGDGSVTIATNGSICGWLATSDAPWLAITAGASGVGASGTITYGVAPNSIALPRTGTISAGGATHSVTQAPAECFVTSILPDAVIFPASGGTGSFAVIVNGPDCAWSGSSTADWITFIVGSGFGNGTLTYEVGPNPTAAPRFTSVVIGGVGRTVRQEPAE